MNCFHCNEIIHKNDLINFDQKIFCCNGCSTVFTILKENGLSNYYDIQNDFDRKKKDFETSSFDYLDHVDFQNEYVEIKSSTKSFSFYVEGIHCSACLWLLEKIDVLVHGVQSSHLDMSTSVLKIYFSQEAKLSNIAKKLEQIGYRPHPVLSGGDVERLNIKENKEDLMRIGIAFACTGNIMLYSISVYLGAPENFSRYFNLFSFLCSIPIIFYCAIPFYIDSYRSLNLKRISIDVPIVIVLILSFLLGVISFLTEFNFYYFDTISTLVFLLLSSRYLLKLVQRKNLNINQVHMNFANQLAHRVKDNREETILAKYIKVDDQLVVRPGEVIPADGVITQGESFINNAILTGEADPIKLKENHTVFMGAHNLDSLIHIRALSTSQDSRMGKILEEVGNKWKQGTFFSGLVDRISQYFTFSVLILALFFFFYFLFQGNLKQAIDNTFSLLLITCPCALAISTPLAMLVGLNLMLKNNIFIKDEKVLEKILKVKNIFFDKTGTLTDGIFSIVFRPDSERFFSIIYSLELKSTHPIGRSISKELKKRGIASLDVQDFQEIRGIGVSGIISGEQYLIKKIKSNSSDNDIALYKNSKVLTSFKVEDSLNPQAKSMVKDLKKYGYNVHLLSGDKELRVRSVALELGIEIENCFYEQSPEQKLKTIELNANSMMIGDGVNDSAAIQLALVGVAIKGSAESSLKASSIYIAEHGIERLIPVINASKRIFRIVKRNLFISLIYNLFGIYLAFNGLVSPVVAAIFMPLSSLSVVLSTLLSIRNIEKLIKNT